MNYQMLSILVILSLDSILTKSLNHWTFLECFVWHVIVTMFDDFIDVLRCTEVDEIPERKTVCW